MDRLNDIQTAINRIEGEAIHGKAAFDSDPKLQVWMIYHIQLIGEAVRSISTELQTLSPSTPWSEIIGMRHILVHNYFGVELEEIWNVVKRDLLPLKSTVNRLIKVLSETETS